MAGILDNKTRVMDVVVTAEGKRQLGSGDFKISYATFTDKNAFYDRTSISGSADSAYTRLYPEAISYVFDQITIEKDDNGAVIPFATVVSDVGDRINTKSGIIIKNGVIEPNTSVNDYSNIANTIIKSTLENFKKQQIIASKDPIDESDTFEVSQNSITFNYGNRGPIIGDDLVVSLDQANSVLTDPIFSNSPNFMFMPPICVDDTGTRVLGQYEDIKKTPDYTLSDLEMHLIGKVPDQPICPSKAIEFTSTSQTNDICIQAFEIGSNIRKLDMVDFGSYDSDSTGGSKRVIFLGKVYIDSFGASNFAKIFTLILE